MAQRTPRTAHEQEAVEQIKRLADDKASEELRQVLSTYEGRCLVWWLMEQSGFYSTSFNGNSRDYYELGKRSVGAQLHARVVDAAGFSAFDTMRREAEARRAEQEALVKKQLQTEDDF